MRLLCCSTRQAQSGQEPSALWLLDVQRDLGMVVSTNTNTNINTQRDLPMVVVSTNTNTQRDLGMVDGGVYR